LRLLLTELSEAINCYTIHSGERSIVFLVFVTGADLCELGLVVPFSTGHHHPKIQYFELLCCDFGRPVFIRWRVNGDAWRDKTEHAQRCIYVVVEKSVNFAAVTYEMRAQTFGPARRSGQLTKLGAAYSEHSVAPLPLRFFKIPWLFKV
jgi:hypothetical protein